MSKPIYGPPNEEGHAAQADGLTANSSEIVVNGEREPSVTSLTDIANYAGRQLGVDGSDVPPIIRQLGQAFLNRVESDWSLKRAEIELRNNPRPVTVVAPDPTFSIKSFNLPLTERLAVHTDCGVMVQGFDVGAGCSLNLRIRLGGNGNNR